MRKPNTILIGPIAALAVVMAPVAARTTDSKTADPQQTSDAPASSPCHSYQQKPDGTWQELPCQEGGGAQAQTPRKPVTHSDATH